MTEQLQIDDPLLGTTLANRYEILSVIGRGGMGVVYKAREENMDRFMAVKMLHAHKVADSEALKRFHHEAKTVCQVKHHNIITIYDFGMSTKGQPYLVMDYLEGKSLKSVLEDEGPLSFERAQHIYDQVCDALASAHALDVVHRDLKPENIMLSDHRGQDRVTVVDFGLSKLKEMQAGEDIHRVAKSDNLCGSPPYMSPEQCIPGNIVDPRSDIYSLAICVYQSLSGSFPFKAKSVIEILDAHLTATPLPLNKSSPHLEVCNELTRVLNTALQKDPAKRQQTIEEFGAELKEALRRDSLKYRTRKHRQEVSSFSDLLSEAEALHQNRKPLQTQAVGQEDAQLISSDSVSPINCLYCHAELKPGIKFCINCQHQLLSNEDVAKIRSVQGFNSLSPTSKTHDSIEFSARAKQSMGKSESVKNSYGLWILLAVIAVILVSCGYFWGLQTMTKTY